VKSNPVLPGPDTVKVNLGVKGGPSCPAFATTQWTTPPTGHYCLQVSFNWLDDANPYNNLGQENTQVGVAHSPVAFQFELHNRLRAEQEFRFETDTYTLPPLTACGDGRAIHKQGPAGMQPGPWSPARVPPQHDRRNFPLPTGWSVSFTPDHPRLHAGEEITVTATVNPPAGFKGRQPINVHVFSESSLAGGVTFYVEGS